MNINNILKLLKETVNNMEKIAELNINDINLSVDKSNNIKYIDDIYENLSNISNVLNKYHDIKNNMKSKIESIDMMVHKYNDYIKKYYEIKDTHKFIYLFDNSYNIELNKYTLFRDVIHPSDLDIKNNLDIKNDIGIKKIIKYKNLDSINGVSLQNNNINIPVTPNLKNIPPMFYWYEGNNIHSQGIYICISEGMYIQVPFPNVIDNDHEDYKKNTIKCKYYDKNICYNNRKKMSLLHNNKKIKECNFVHKNEFFNKISDIYRCNITSIGNHKTLNEDLNKLNIEDIKYLLMNNTSDLLLILLWFQNKFKDSNDIVLNKLDMC
jgi:hypothetical protein